MRASDACFCSARARARETSSWNNSAAQDSRNAAPRDCQACPRRDNQRIDMLARGAEHKPGTGKGRPPASGSRLPKSAGVGAMVKGHSSARAPPVCSDRADASYGTPRTTTTRVERRLCRERSRAGAVMRASHGRGRSFPTRVDGRGAAYEWITSAQGLLPSLPSLSHAAELRTLGADYDLFKFPEVVLQLQRADASPARTESVGAPCG